jgi:hypothetical protein
MSLFTFPNTHSGNTFGHPATTCITDVRALADLCIVFKDLTTYKPFLLYEFDAVDFRTLINDINTFRVSYRTPSFDSMTEKISSTVRKLLHSSALPKIDSKINSIV